MTLSDIASIGSLISGVAVLISLVYLGLQVRQTEKNQRAMLNQGSIERVSNLCLALSQPFAADVFARAREPNPDFSSQEVITLSLLQRAMLLGLQDAMVQHRGGLIDQITFDNGASALKEAFAWPVFRVIWLANRGSYAPELATYVDNLFLEIPLREPTDIGARFKTLLAAATSAK